MSDKVEKLNQPLQKNEDKQGGRKPWLRQGGRRGQVQQQKKKDPTEIPIHLC